HLERSGASYTGRLESFIQGRPLNVTDLDFGPDGAMYFVVGGRGTQAALYRVSYAGSQILPQQPDARQAAAQAAPARSERVALEKYHKAADAAAIDVAWPYLGSN